jgi:hypothetical protein
LTKKTQRQLMPDVSAPPISGPIDNEAPAVAPKTPKAVPRSRPLNSRASNASALANIAAPPIPCAARLRIKNDASGARPQSSEATVKTTKPPAKTLRCPIRSPSDPVTSSIAASDSA